MLKGKTTRNQFRDYRLSRPRQIPRNLLEKIERLFTQSVVTVPRSPGGFILGFIMPGIVRGVESGDHRAACKRVEFHERAKACLTPRVAYKSYRS